MKILFCTISHHDEGARNLLDPLTFNFEDSKMTDDEIIEKIKSNQWWPFDRVDPKVLQELVHKEKQQTIDEVGEALL